MISLLIYTVQYRLREYHTEQAAPISTERKRVTLTRWRGLPDRDYVGGCYAEK